MTQLLRINQVDEDVPKKENSKERFQDVSASSLKKFLERYQKERKSYEEVCNLIRKYEPSESKKEMKLSLNGLILYLNDYDQHLLDVSKTDHVYQNMAQPLVDYFISSSHNT